MNTHETAMAHRIAEAARSFQLMRTGHAPQSVTVVLGDDTLVITLHGALSPAERRLAERSAGAAQVQEFHRQLFASSSDALRNEITRITGREVREAAAEVEPASGVVVHAFSTGSMVQVFHLAEQRPEEISGALVDSLLADDAGSFAGTAIFPERKSPC